MARGVQPGPIQIAEERQCELVALGMDLIANDGERRSPPGHQSRRGSDERGGAGSEV